VAHEGDVHLEPYRSVRSWRDRVALERDTFRSTPDGCG
jgi:hypothetical protein